MASFERRKRLLPGNRRGHSAEERLSGSEVRFLGHGTVPAAASVTRSLLRGAIAKTKTPPFAAGSSWGGSAKSRSGGDALFHLVRLAQHIAAAPHCFDEIASFGGVGELLAQLADEDVDDLQFRLVHAAIEVIEEHFLGQRRALAQREQLEHLVFLARQMHPLTTDLDGLGVEIDYEIAGLDH